MRSDSLRKPLAPKSKARTSQDSGPLMLPVRRSIWINDETVKNYTFAPDRAVGDDGAWDHSRCIAAKNDREKSGDPEDETRFRTSGRTPAGISGGGIAGGDDWNHRRSARRTSRGRETDSTLRIRLWQLQPTDFQCDCAAIVAARRCRTVDRAATFKRCCG